MLIKFLNIINIMKCHYSAFFNNVLLLGYINAADR